MVNNAVKLVYTTGGKNRRQNDGLIVRKVRGPGRGPRRLIVDTDLHVHGHAVHGNGRPGGDGENAGGGNIVLLPDGTQHDGRLRAFMPKPEEDVRRGIAQHLHVRQSAAR